MQILDVKIIEVTKHSQKAVNNVINGQHTIKMLTQTRILIIQNAGILMEAQQFGA